MGEKAAFMKGPQWDRYAQTKLANSVFAKALDDRITASEDTNAQKVKSLCAHPGVSDTNLGDHLSFGKVTDAIFNVVSKMVVQSKEDGPMGLTGYPVPMPPQAYESNPKSKNMLWKASET